ncbi:MAG: hypothetical protein K0Q43_101 [Ramlibacter sp.]|jgi:hypothetical protein|nr:hypothetical protein [Ramlibacter sp.]
MNATHTVDMGALQRSLSRTASGLRSSPRALLAIAALACAGSAQAQFGGTYERAGSSVGYEVGRAVGAKSPAAQGVASVMAQLLGGQVGKIVDDEQRLEQQAIDKARADAAYEAERRRLDPSYQPYSAASQRGSASIGLWSTGASAFASVDAQQAALLREWQQRNGRAQGSQTSEQVNYPRP